jgi:isoquinoline 1-oxidoreductase subunit beta
MGASFSRRAFLQRAAALAGGLCVGFRWGAALAEGQPTERLLATWVRIERDGAVTIFSNATEIGQGSSSALPQILAEELEVDWPSVRVEYAPLEPAYFNPILGTYQTGGSTAVSGMFEPLRRAGATARALLVSAAAQGWSVPEAECRAAQGKVQHIPTGRSASYGELVDAAAKLPAPASVTLKGRGDWRLIGRPLARLDVPSKTDGTAIYGIDVRLPGMLYAAIAHAPQFGGKLGSVDDSPLKAMKGVRGLVHLERAIAVVAEDRWIAQRALDALQPAWQPGGAPLLDSAGLSKQLADALAGGGTPHVVGGGDTAEAVKRNAAAFERAARVHEAFYEAPLLAHATLEPMNATAWSKGDRLEVWAPTQVQAKQRADIAAALKMPQASVTLHSTQVGGGFGRRLETDYGVLAAQVARQFPVPVQLIWSREEDMQHDFYRPAAVARLRAALDGADACVAIRIDTAAVNDSEPLGGFADTQYALPLCVVNWTSVMSPVPIGAWRSVDHSQNCFFFESWLDELAIATHRDPIEFRRQWLAKNPRALRVLETALQRAGYPDKRMAGRHYGTAVGSRDGTLVAQVAEISLTPERVLRVHRVSCAIDCGIAVNPQNARAQCEGGVIFGLSAALFGRITLANGRVEQGNFGDYPLLRMSQAPAIEVDVLEPFDESIKPTGCGEPPVPPIAPAVVNAIGAATGERLRKLPITAAGYTVA